MFQNSRINNLQNSGIDQIKQRSSCLGPELKKKTTLYEEIKTFEKKNNILAIPGIKVRNCGFDSPSLSIKPGFTYQTSLKE